MTAKNMKELNNMLLKEMQKAMDVTEAKAKTDMYEETAGFYTKGNPTVYERTGALGDTPRTTPITANGNTVEFDAYLDTTHRYTTSKNPTMEDVLKLTNSGDTNSSVGHLRPAVGKKGYWDRAREKMERDLRDTMKKFFK